MKARTWVFISGVLWLLAGFSLLRKGIFFLSQGIQTTDSLAHKWASFIGSPQSVGSVLMAAALLVGFLKGRLVFAKTVKKVTTRIYSLPTPIKITSVYPPAYWAVIAFMVGLGVSMKYLPIPVDLRGFVDVAIGSALMNGAVLYFRAGKPVAT